MPCRGQLEWFPVSTCTQVSLSFISWQSAESKPSWRVERCMFEGTNGHYFFMTTANSTPKILGKGCCTVSSWFWCVIPSFYHYVCPSIYWQAYKHVFTLPSSVNHDETKVTRSGNAHIHGMTCVTIGSLAYIATQVGGNPLLSRDFQTHLWWQVHFGLSSASTFSHMDTVTDSKRFYYSLFDMLDDPKEKKEVDVLLSWWNR